MGSGQGMSNGIYDDVMISLIVVYSTSTVHMRILSALYRIRHADNYEKCTSVNSHPPLKWGCWVTRLPYPYKMFWTRDDLLVWYSCLSEHHSYTPLSPSHTHTHTCDLTAAAQLIKLETRCCYNSLVGEINQRPKNKCDGAEEAVTHRVWIMVAINCTSRSTWLITQDNVVGNDVDINLMINVCLCNQILYLLISRHYAIHICTFWFIDIKLKRADSFGKGRNS